MITTLCLNPSFDRTVEVASMTVGGTNRILSARRDAGGKGINVMRVCVRLGSPAQCVMAAGSGNAAAFEACLAEEGLAGNLRTVNVPGEIRTNTKIVSRDGQPLTELNERGAAVDGAALARITELLRAGCDPEDFTVLTGSLPPECPEGTYARLMEAVGGGRCVLDVGGRELMLGLAAHPMLVKPNLDELESAVGRKLTGRKEIAAAARELIASGAENAVVSMGGDGAMLVTPEETFYAPAVKVKVSSTVGAGDAMVAGLMCGLQRSGDLREAFRCAVAAGTASVMTEGTQLVRPEDYAAVLPRVALEAL